jgi:hypothetical protein
LCCARMKAMHKVSQITIPGGIEIELYYNKGQLAYSFEYEGKPYGTKVTLPSKSIIDIASVCLVLFTNAQETYKELTKQ